MARYQNSIPIGSADINFVANEIARYMTGEGFNLIDYNGQKVWKKGFGILTAPQYLVLSFAPGAAVVEAFIKYPLLPGVYVGEMGITGAFAFVPKSLLKTRVDSVESYLRSILPRTAPMPYAPQPQQPPQD